MALFSKRRTLFQRAQGGDWKSRQEKTEGLRELAKESFPAQEVIPLVLHIDPEVRAVAVPIFLASADAGAVTKLIADAVAENAQQNLKHLHAVLPKVPADIVDDVMGQLLGSKVERQRRLGWELVPALGLELRSKYLQKAIREAPSQLRPNLLRQLLRDEPADKLVPVLLEFAASEDPQLANVALEGASGIPDTRVAELMVDRFAYGEAVAREMAYKYLTKMGKARPDLVRRRILELLAAGDDDIRRMGMTILFSTGPAKEVLVDVLMFLRDLIGWLRGRILNTLLTFGDDVLVPAIDLLTHPEERVRASALVLCEQFDDPRIVVPPTLELLKSEDWWLRVLACETLGRMADKRAIPGLVKALADEDTRWAAIEALAHVSSDDALRYLEPLLGDPRPEVRLEVIGSLQQFNDQHLFEALRKVASTDASAEVRTRATEVLRRMALELKVKLKVDDVPIVAPEAARRPIEKLLVEVRRRGASDVHITVDEPPFIRVDGNLARMDGLSALSARHSKNAIAAILDDAQKDTLDAMGEVDFCHAIPEVGRYRGNAFLQRKGLCAVFRVIPNIPPTLADLRLPAGVKEILDMNQGMVIVSGPAGCGKSTTMSALVNLINETKPVHIITLEDPIELVHPRKVGLVDQRQVGTHTKSFARALRAALREDPDVVLVGEMRDPETIRMALTAAETGHLVIATMHTNRAIGCIDRLVESFVPEEQPQVRLTLADTLKLVIAQQLVPRVDGRGRVACFEMLRIVASVAGLIRDNKTHQIPNVMVMGRRLGMQTLDQSLLDLVEAQLIGPDTAYGRADKPEDFTRFFSPQALAEFKRAQEIA